VEFCTGQRQKDPHQDFLLSGLGAGGSHL
jgi:hypothetical protein